MNQDDVKSLRRAVVRLGQKLRGARSASSLTPTETAVVGYLFRAGAAQPRQVAAGLGLQPQSLTRVLHQLEEQQLLSKSADPDDGRALLLTLTDFGRRALDADMASRDAWLATAIDRLSPMEVGLLALAAALLDRLCDLSEDENVL